MKKVSLGVIYILFDCFKIKNGSVEGWRRKGWNGVLNI